MIKRHVVKMHLAEYRNGHVQEYPEKDIIQEVVANHEHLDQDFGNENHEAILDEIIGRMEEKEVVLDLDEETEMNIFCKEFLNVDYEEYEEALKITKKGKILILKRRINERFTNNYNPEMLFAWDANMDLQIAIDPYAIITYVVSYMNKDETQMTKVLTEALKSDAKQNAQEKLKTLKMAYLTHRQVGASEATYRILKGMKLKNSNIGCVFVITGFPQNRSHFWKKVVKVGNDEFDVNETDDNGEDESDEQFIDHLGKQPIKLAGKEGYFTQATTVHERYAVRPENLEKICLAQFATSYVPISKLPIKAEIASDGCSKDLSSSKIFNSNVNLPKHIELGDGLGYMRLRTFPAVLRIHSSKRKEGHEQYYSELLLFSYWRNEVNEFYANSPEDCIAEHEKRKLEINANREKMYPGEATIELLDVGDLQSRKPEHLTDILDPQGDQNNEDDLDIECVEDPEFESFGYFGNLNMNEGESRAQVEDFKYKKICLPSKEEMKHMTRQLVPEQLNVLRKVIVCCKAIVRARNNPNLKPKPIRMIVHGGAGVGKSMAIRAAALHAENILRKAGDDVHKPRILLCSFTAKAANLIDGITFHSAFGFKVGNSICYLSDKRKAELKNNLEDLKLIIIDEVSLIGADMLYRIHLRLCTLFNSDESLPFANINMMLVGDLLQLPPVLANHVFREPRDTALKACHDGLNKPLWEEFMPMRVIGRQKNKQNKI